MRDERKWEKILEQGIGKRLKKKIRGDKREKMHEEIIIEQRRKKEDKRNQKREDKGMNREQRW